MKIRMSLSGILVDYKSTRYKILHTIEHFIITHFFPIRCHCCDCGDCQLGNDGREYWYCPHLKADICTICCIYDSNAPDRAYKECTFCSHDQDREKGGLA